jgi:hypothetical protein
MVSLEIDRQSFSRQRSGGLRVTVFCSILVSATGLAAESSAKHARITPFQRTLIERLVTPDKLLPAHASARISEAAPHIKRFLAEMSCRFDPSRQAFEFTVGPSEKRTPYNDSGAMAEMSSAHRLTVCLTLEEVRWVSVEVDVVVFEVIFRSDDSLETLRKRYSATRQPQGAWVFSYPLRTLPPAATPHRP